MQGQGYLAKPQHSPTSFGLAFLVTGAGVAALLLASPYVKTYIADAPIDVFHIPLEKPKPVEPIKQPKTVIVPQPIRSLTSPLPAFDPPQRIVVGPVTPIDLTGVTGGSNDFVKAPYVPPVEIAPMKPPVITDARNDPRFARDLQPPYPPALQREDVEGTVTVRVRIGTDGRVLAVEPVRADHDGFLSVTRDWAIRKWRFVPATRDGAPIESWRTMTVRFNIER